MLAFEVLLVTLAVGLVVATIGVLGCLLFGHLTGVDRWYQRDQDLRRQVQQATEEAAARRQEESRYRAEAYQEVGLKTTDEPKER